MSTIRIWRRQALLTFIGCIGSIAQAQDTGQPFGNPPDLDARYGLSRSAEAAAIDGAAPRDAPAAARRRPKPEEAPVDLRIVRTEGSLWNPATGRHDRVALRSYQGDRVDPAFPFVSPALEVRPGNTVRIRLDNQLTYQPDPRIGDPGCVGLPAGHDHNVPHCFDGTNLHGHGLWVNPEGNSDNVLITINPGTQFEYEYNIPYDHPAGTFWYHSHRHGSTALQVSSGMAGALIVRGDRQPTPEANGDLDTLLRPTRRQPFPERIVVMQQIQYACLDALGAVKKNPDGSWLCEEGDVGTIDKYAGQLDGPADWRTSGRYTSINGRILPTFGGAKVGRIERWRMIHGGIRDSITVQFRKLRPGAPSAARLGVAEQAAYIDRYCTGEPLPQHLVAADGLTLAAARATDRVTFQPAYRWDMLMVFPSDGQYCMIDTEAPAAATVAQISHSRQLLGLVQVDKAGRSIEPDRIAAHLATELINAARQNLSATVRERVAAELRDGLKLSRFVDHPTIDASEVTGVQRANFSIGRNAGTGQPQFMIDGASYATPDSRTRELVLGSVDRWELTGQAGGHPFHIHVNPFQIVAILDPDGKDVSAADAIDDFGGQVDPQYRGLKGAWKDTIFLKSLPAATPGGPPRSYTIIAHSRYRRYIGRFVLHCHILDHEDQGMMQDVRIVLPTGTGTSPADSAALSPPARHHGL